MFDLDRYAPRLLALHDHICPRQVLGLRMAEHAAAALGLELPREDKRLIAFVEMDGCFADGVMVASGCSMGHRTLRLVDEGKIAATFVDTRTRRALRVWPRADARVRALAAQPGAKSRWHAQFEAYQCLPVAELLQMREVALALDLDALISRNGLRVICDRCGEEITNARELHVQGETLCRSCAGQSYIRAHSVAEPARIPVAAA